MKPYLSIVVTSRNDDHGGDLLRRMQTFLNALVGQTKRHGLPVELLLVEWNRPPEKPPLGMALEWPEDFGPFSARIIQVPLEVHQRYRHADALPLYQMIAKNAGIRRAQGDFILATNIDILFSDELFRFLSGRKLEPGKMYRIDRYDIDSNVPADAAVDAQLEYAKNHLLRINTREGTFGLTPDGFRALAPEDIAAPDDGIFLGRGWFPPERHFTELFRWVENDAEVIVKPVRTDRRVLAFEMEPGPGVGCRPFLLQAVNESGAVVAEVRIERRSILRLPVFFEAGKNTVFRLRAVGGGFKTAHDPRLLNFRVFRCSWQREATRSGANPQEAVPAVEQLAEPVSRTAGLIERTWKFVVRGARFARDLRRAKGPVRVGLPLSPRSVEKLDLRLEGGGISIAIDPTWRPWIRPAAAGAAQSALDFAGRLLPAASGPAHLHTNACGDFTLLARAHWFDLRGYPEFDLFPMNLDSVLCYAAHYEGAVEEILPEPMRIYHIEHAAGSGWTPEGQAKLFERVAAEGLSWIDYHEVVGWAAQMQRLGCPMIFNRENWGLADFDLPETVLRPARTGPFPDRA